MPPCAAFGCKNRPEKKLPGVSFHRFPQNELRCKQWMIIARRVDWQPRRWSCLCSQHFEESQIDRSSLASVRLRENAVPTIFAPTPSPYQNKNQLKKSKGSLPKNSPDVKKRTKKAQKKRDPKAAAKIKKLIVDPGDTGNALQSSSGGSLFDPNIVIKQEIIETEDPCDLLQVLRADNKPKLIKPNPSSTTNSSDKSS